MQKQKLPNEQSAMILALTSFVGCCCTSGVLGIILSLIGIHLAKKDEATYNENPENYDIQNVKTWKTVNTISLVLSILSLVYAIYMKVTGKDVEQQEQLMEMLRQFQKN
ncbi:MULTISPECIES: CCC motif membrane protein [unclassified Flavobacterium]|uniref:CCC motif membrane protein n=1 Tax=unclassified Flavobacterium TaxID=196869 RepID=UPI003618C1A6